MKKALLLIVMNMLAISAFTENTIVRLNDGREVILHDDYTWEYYIESGKNETKIENEVIYNGKIGIANIHYNSKNWKTTNPFSPSTEISFINERGDGYASFVEERIQVPLGSMEDILTNTLSKNGLKIDIIDSSIENIDGISYLFMKISGEISGIKVVYQYKVWSGNRGTVQIIVFTATNLFNEYFDDFQEILNGLEICEKD
jgi:hypothetical protein